MSGAGAPHVEGDAAAVDVAKLAVLLGSATAALVGAAVLGFGKNAEAVEAAEPTVPRPT